MCVTGNGKRKFDKQVWKELLWEYRTGIPYYYAGLQFDPGETRKKKLVKKQTYRGNTGTPYYLGTNGAR